MQTVSFSAICFRETDSPRVYMTEVGSVCVCLHVSAFSREEAPLQIKLDKRKRAAGKEKN